MVPLSLDVTGIIMEGMRRYDEWQLIRQRVPDSSVVPEIMRPLDMDALSDREKLIVPYIDGQRTIEEIALQTHNAEFTVSKLISEGLRTGTMRLRRDAAREAAPPPVLGAGVSEVDHFLAARPRPAQGRSAGRLPDVQGRLRARPDRRPDRRVDPRGRARDQGRARDGRRHRREDPRARDRRSQSLTERPFSPHEGFVLSRINGQWDVKSIMKISPIKELEVLMIFQKFLKDGVIRWKEAEAARRVSRPRDATADRRERAFRGLADRASCARRAARSSCAALSPGHPLGALAGDRSSSPLSRSSPSACACATRGNFVGLEAAALVPAILLLDSPGAAMLVCVDGRRDRQAARRNRAGSRSSSAFDLAQLCALLRRRPPSSAAALHAAGAGWVTVAALGRRASCSCSSS